MRISGLGLLNPRVRADVKDLVPQSSLKLVGKGISGLYSHCGAKGLGTIRFESRGPWKPTQLSPDFFRKAHADKLVLGHFYL